jgi:hypothetical protein
MAWVATMAAEPKNEERLAVVAAHNALELLLEWDKSRDFIVPYRVRDPIHAALKQLRAVLSTTGVLGTLNEQGEKPK